MTERRDFYLNFHLSTNASNENIYLCKDKSNFLKLHKIPSVFPILVKHYQPKCSAQHYFENHDVVQK